ncbi:MAG: SH3 domain-containing protein [Chloroflexi bacterium]|nr:SH3 domain-containing protein [Chloroflexota bacterium]
MTQRLFISLLSLLFFTGVIQSQPSGLPACDNEDLKPILDLVIKFQLASGASITTMDELIGFAVEQLYWRDNELARLPSCWEAHRVHLSVIRLIGELVGRTALELDGMPESENPFLRIVPSYQERLQELVVTAMSIDPNLTTAPEREPPPCPRQSADELSDIVFELQALEAVSLGIEDRNKILASIDRQLQWLDDALARLQDCADAIEISLLVAKLTSDLSALQALTFAGVPEGANPFGRPMAQHTQSLIDLADELPAAEQELVSSESLSRVLAVGRSGELPACTIDDQVQAWARVAESYHELLDTMQTVENMDDLLTYSRLSLDIRETVLPLVKLCAENFDYVWLLSQELSDLVTWFAMRFDDMPRKAIPFTELNINALTEHAAADEQITQWIKSGEWKESDAESETDPPTCTDADILHLYAIVEPDFREFTDVAMSVQTRIDFLDLVNRLIMFRDALKAEIPRCAEALEVGLVIRDVVSDFVTMYAMDNAGAAAEDIPYLEQIREDMDWFFARRDELLELSDSVEKAKTYYVTANPYANIRSCASTNCAIVGSAQNGEALTVIDDSKDWYEIRLENGETAFIAGFLMSKTKP